MKTVSNFLALLIFFIYVYSFLLILTGTSSMHFLKNIFIISVIFNQYFCLNQRLLYANI